MWKKKNGSWLLDLPAYMKPTINKAGEGDCTLLVGQSKKKPSSLWTQPHLLWSLMLTADILENYIYEIEDSNAGAVISSKSQILILLKSVENYGLPREKKTLTLKQAKQMLPIKMAPIFVVFQYAGFRQIEGGRAWFQSLTTQSQGFLVSFRGMRLWKTISPRHVCNAQNKADWNFCTKNILSNKMEFCPWKLPSWIQIDLLIQIKMNILFLKWLCTNWKFANEKYFNRSIWSGPGQDTFCGGLLLDCELIDSEHLSPTVTM